MVFNCVLIPLNWSQDAALMQENGQWEEPLAAPHDVVPMPLAAADEQTADWGAFRVGDAASSLGDAKSSLGDAKSSLGDAKSSLGDAKSSLG
jgi:hypothetical protein